MTDQQHPITPPPELRTQWRTEAPIYRDFGVGRENWLMNRAAQWGSDQELEACREVVNRWIGPWHPGIKLPDRLRAARRPKPPSLKEQALLQLDTLKADLTMHGRGCDLSQIRRALEQLND
jgi:hypothetical protein